MYDVLTEKNDQEKTTSSKAPPTELWDRSLKGRGLEKLRIAAESHTRGRKGGLKAWVSETSGREM